jgi:hypothetical protein
MNGYLVGYYNERRDTTLRPMQNKISIFLVREQNLFPFSIIDVVT